MRFLYFISFNQIGFYKFSYIINNSTVNPQSNLFYSLLLYYLPKESSVMCICLSKIPVTTDLSYFVKRIEEKYYFYISLYIYIR